MADLTPVAPPSLLARLRAAAGGVRDRLRRAYVAELIAMLPDEVDGKPRRWRVAPPANTSVLAPLLRPYVWQVAIPVTIAGTVGRWMRVGHRSIPDSVGEALFVAVGIAANLWFWSWLARKLFERHWQRMAIDAYNGYAWRRLRDSDEVRAMVGPGDATPDAYAPQPPRRPRWPLRRLWRDR